MVGGIAINIIIFNSIIIFIFFCMWYPLYFCGCIYCSCWTHILFVVVVVTMVVLLAIVIVLYFYSFYCTYLHAYCCGMVEWKWTIPTTSNFCAMPCLPCSVTETDVMIWQHWALAFLTFSWACVAWQHCSGIDEDCSRCRRTPFFWTKRDQGSPLIAKFNVKVHDIKVLSIWVIFEWYR